MKSSSILILFVSLIVSSCKPAEDVPYVPIGERKKIIIDKSPKMQKQRERAVQAMLNDGWILKYGPVEKHSTITWRVWITPEFRFRLNIDEKAKLLNVLYAYVLYGYPDESLILADSISGRDIGRFTPPNDLDLD